MSFRICTADFYARISKVSMTRQGLHPPRDGSGNVQNAAFPKVFSEYDTILSKDTSVPFRRCADDSRQNLESFHDTGKFPMCHFASELRFPADSVKGFHNIGSMTRGGVRYRPVKIWSTLMIKTGGVLAMKRGCLLPGRPLWLAGWADLAIYRP